MKSGGCNSWRVTRDAGSGGRSSSTGAQLSLDAMNVAKKRGEWRVTRDAGHGASGAEKLFDWERGHPARSERSEKA